MFKLQYKFNTLRENAQLFVKEKLFLKKERKVVSKAIWKAENL